MKKRSSQSVGKKAKGRTAHTYEMGQGGGTHLEMQRQIRNAGTNRLVGSSDHLHRGDRRDMAAGQEK